MRPSLATLPRAVPEAAVVPAAERHHAAAREQQERMVAHAGHLQHRGVPKPRQRARNREQPRRLVLHVGLWVVGGNEGGVRDGG